MGDEPLRYLSEAAARFNNPDVKTVVDWTAKLDKGMKQHQLRAWVPLWIRELAEMQQFDCHSYPVIAYEGHERAKMVHFAFLFRFLPGRDLRVSSSQREGELMSLPLLEIRDSQMLYLTNPGQPCSVCTQTQAVAALDLEQLLTPPAPLTATPVNPFSL